MRAAPTRSRRKLIGMGFERKPERAVVVHHMLGERHDGKRDQWLAAGIGRHRHARTAAAAIPWADRAPPTAPGGGRARASGRHRPRRASPGLRASARCAATDRACRERLARAVLARRVASEAWFAIGLRRKRIGSGGSRGGDTQALHVVLAQSVDLAHAERSAEAPCLRYWEGPFAGGSDPPGFDARAIGIARRVTGSSVQSQRLRLTSASRASTPCSRAQRTICAGA